MTFVIGPTCRFLFLLYLYLLRGMPSYHNLNTITLTFMWGFKVKFENELTLNFFFLSGVMKPFFCFVPAFINSVRTLSLRLDLSLKMGNIFPFNWTKFDMWAQLIYELWLTYSSASAIFPLLPQDFASQMLKPLRSTGGEKEGSPHNLSGDFGKVARYHL